MNTTQKLQLRQSEIRAKMSDLLELETRSEQQDADLEILVREARSTETALQAAILAEPPITTTTAAPGTDGETRERLQLRSQFRVHRVIGSLLNSRAVDGVEAEYTAAVGGAAGSIPVDVFESERRSDEDGGGLETRAVTPGVQGGTTQRPIVPAIFDRSVAPWLGIMMPSAGVGDQAFPVLSTSVTAGVAARGGTALQTAGAFTVATVEPRRLTASFKFRVEDAARLSGMEAALRMNLREALTDELDNQIVNGSAASGGEDGKLRGLLGILADPADPATGAEDWARFNSAFSSHIDGLFAVDERGVRALVGPHTLRLMSQIFRGNNTENSFAHVARNTYGGVRATRRIADPASNVQQAIVRRANPRGDSVAVMPHWNSMTIRDIYSGATEGEIVITSYMLVGDVVVLRDDAFVQDSFRLA